MHKDIRARRRTTQALAASVMLFMAAHGASASTVLVPTSATASTVYVPGTPGTTASNLINPAYLNGSNEYQAALWGSNKTWLSNDTTTGNQWIYVDLGASYSLAEVRIWNYAEVAPVNTNGRGVNAYSLWVGGTDAILPTGTSATPFTTGGLWTSVSSGTLAIGPVSQTTAGAMPPFGPTDTLIVSGSGRYVGIDVGSRHGTDPYTTVAVGLSFIQILAVPEPSSLTLLAFGSIGLWLMRRKQTTQYVISRLGF